MIHLLIIGHAPRSLATAVLVGKVGGARQELTTRQRIDVVSVTSRSLCRPASNLAVLSGGRDHDAVGNAPRARIIRVGSARGRRTSDTAVRT